MIGTLVPEWIHGTAEEVHVTRWGSEISEQIFRKAN